MITNDYILDAILVIVIAIVLKSILNRRKKLNALVQERIVRENKKK